MTRKTIVWIAFVLFALGLVGSVAWPLWSENDLWAQALLGPPSVLLLLVIMWPVIQGLRDAFDDSDC